MLVISWSCKKFNDNKKNYLEEQNFCCRAQHLFPCALLLFSNPRENFPSFRRGMHLGTVYGKTKPLVSTGNFRIFSCKLGRFSTTTQGMWYNFPLKFFQYVRKIAWCCWGAFNVLCTFIRIKYISGIRVLDLLNRGLGFF